MLLSLTLKVTLNIVPGWIGKVVSKGKREKEGHKMKVRFEAQDRFFILEDDGISDGGSDTDSENKDLG
jgi:hypothetical protein